jgi:hypothetical protein
MPGQHRKGDISLNKQMHRIAAAKGSIVALCVLNPETLVQKILMRPDPGDDGYLGRINHYLDSRLF